MTHMIFDLDGTLLSSMHIWRTLGADYLKTKNVTPPDDFFAFMKTRTLVDTSEYIHTVLGLELSPEEILAEIIAIVEQFYGNEAMPKPNVPAFLEQEYAKGTKMCVLTASELRYIMPALERLGFLKYFDFVMTCSEVNLHKDTPEIFDIAAKRLGGTAENTAVFEDSLYAVKGAKSGGYTVYAIAEDTAKDDEDAIIALADRFIFDYAEILDK